jgi:hypothetical protein
MRKRISFSGEHQELTGIAAHHSDVADALQLYFSPTDGRYRARFAGYSLAELKDELQSRLAEVDRTSALSVLSALEAAFRIDYLQRCYAKKKDRVSRAFRTIHKHKGPRPALDEDILAVWRRESTTPVTTDTRVDRRVPLQALARARSLLDSHGWDASMTMRVSMRWPRPC